MIRKSKRVNMGEYSCHEQDAIEDLGDVAKDFSNLPDCILHHIISFMPTKEAVKTSILSTRWKNLWAFVPNIDLDDRLFCGRDVDGRSHFDATSFINFVERFLRLRDAMSVERFRLSCYTFLDEFQIHSWISDAINHNVQKLHLVVSGEAPTMIPWSILDRSSLVCLKIKTAYVGELPSCISFPCLKTLQLQFAMFPNDDHAEKLLLGCPVLEELLLLDIWKNLNNIVISNSTLKSLTIRDMMCFGAFNDPTSGCKIKIDAPNLTSFKYEGFLSHEILLNNAFSLVKACICVLSHRKWKKLVACRAINLLKQLQYVVSLRVSNPTIESLVSEENMQVRIPMFKNLSHLTLTWKIRTKTLGALMFFLNFCPALKSLCFSKGFKHCIPLDENNPIWPLLAACVSNCLKTVTFKNFHGYDSEACFLKCILKYACVLERMEIWWFKGQLRDLNLKKTEVRNELETIERVSKSCVIKFK